MKSTELAKHVNDIVIEAQERILIQGAEQYEDEEGNQQFETMPIRDLITYLEEELLDQINYAVMTLLQLRQKRAILDRVDKEVVE